MSLLVGVAAWGGEPTADAQSAGLDFFESRVRPVLAEHCYGCHSAQARKLKGGLRLDTAEGISKGGDTGPAVVPGNPEESLLVRAVRHDEDVSEMPPKGKLPDATIRVLEQWVKAGAAVPSSGPSVSRTAPNTKPKTGSFNLEEARKHWAYRPVRRQEPPPVKDPGWCRTSIDRFVLARLEAAGLTPSPPADRRTLLRRVSYDLIGLPPTAGQIEAFERDRSDESYARVVDQLLASPRYGERWGRHWLDVARYADTKDGVLMYGDDRVRPYAYTYRDYVIRALNEDTPFDRFVQEQLAADQVAPRDQPWRLAAMGFLTLGRMFDNNIHDQIDDKIDTVSRGLLGLTVACARCHDHKYDAVATSDYYALYGVFASSEPPFELPLIEPIEKRPGCSEFEKQADAKRAELRKILDSQYDTLSEAARVRVGDYLARAALTEPDPLETAIFFLSLSPEDLRPQIVARWRRFLKQRATPDDPVFGPWHDLMKLAPDDFAAEASAVLAQFAARPAGTKPGSVNPLVLAALQGASLRSRADVPRVYGELIRRVYEESRKAKSSGSSVGSGLDPASRQVLDIVASHDSPAYFPKSQCWAYMSRSEKDSFGGKQVELDRMAVKAAGKAAARAMVLTDSEQPYEPRVFVRGNPAQPGDHVPRRFLRVLAGENPSAFAHGSGRLDLARAITAPDNPLTSRVIVNRVWMNHFGEPLVSTPSDFGTRSNPPTHPELLDDLAARFVQEGWSLKKLHRWIVLSRTYQQASFDRPEARKVDPENRLLWRFNRRRLDLESMRDTLLAVSGRLDLTMGGRPVDVVDDPKTTRRTVYGLVDRQSLPAAFRAFDFASPDLSSERRPRTTVPQQALFSMNSPLVLEQARAISSLPEVAAAKTPDARITALYRRVLARAPDAVERESALRFLDEPSAGKNEPSGLDRTQQLAQVLIMTNELFFVD
ncbi:MAG: PSD1 and planctomycete cytochrome C domain-containing protein [Isosphaeraceae bacterium]